MNLSRKKNISTNVDNKMSLVDTVSSIAFTWWSFSILLIPWKSQSPVLLSGVNSRKLVQPFLLNKFELTFKRFNRNFDSFVLAPNNTFSHFSKVPCTENRLTKHDFIPRNLPRFFAHCIVSFIIFLHMLIFQSYNRCRRDGSMILPTSRMCHICCWPLTLLVYADVGALRVRFQTSLVTCIWLCFLTNSYCNWPIIIIVTSRRTAWLSGGIFNHHLVLSIELLKIESTRKTFFCFLFFSFLFFFFFLYLFVCLFFSVCFCLCVLFCFVSFFYRKTTDDELIAMDERKWCRFDEVLYLVLSQERYSNVNILVIVSYLIFIKLKAAFTH